MGTPDLSWLDLETASRLIQCKELRPSELVEFMIARIERLNPSLNAYVLVLTEQARAQAHAADVEIAAGRWRGPLHGLTFAVKDMIHAAGVRTTGGSNAIRDYIAGEDAVCVARLREAGAILLGKTHTHELAAGVTSENKRFGRAKNPWNPDFIPGGSSGGSAIVAAAGLAHFTLGTDTGGSVRIPAAFCGVAGLKATYGMISTRGVLARSWTMDHVGIFGRRIKDTALVLDAAAGHDPRDPYSEKRETAPVAPNLISNVRGLRIGRMSGDFFEVDVDPQIAAAFAQALADLESLGAIIKPVKFELAEAALAAGTMITISESASALSDILAQRPDDFGEDVRNQLRLAEFISARQYLQALKVRSAVQAELGSLFSGCDVLVSPTTCCMPTPSSGETTPESLVLLAKNTRPFSLPGFPAVSVPAGFSSNQLPIGLQIIGAPFDEATALRTAHAFEAATSWHERHPPNVFCRA